MPIDLDTGEEIKIKKNKNEKSKDLVKKEFARGAIQ